MNTIKWTKAAATGLLVGCFVLGCGGGNPVSGGGTGADNAGAPSSASAIVGTWVWFNLPTVYIDADGQLRLPGAVVVGQWVSIDAANGLYRLTWVNGFIDSLKLSADEDELAGYNQIGTYVTGARAQ